MTGAVPEIPPENRLAIVFEASGVVGRPPPADDDDQDRDR